MTTKTKILKSLDDAKIECPNCKEAKLSNGMMSLEWQIPALFCPKCNYRLSLIMIERVDNYPECGII